MHNPAAATLTKVSTRRFEKQSSRSHETNRNAGHPASPAVAIECSTRTPTRSAQPTAQAFAFGGRIDRSVACVQNNRDLHAGSEPASASTARSCTSSPRTASCGAPALPDPARPATLTPGRPPRWTRPAARTRSDHPAAGLQPRWHPGRAPAHPGRSQPCWPDSHHPACRDHSPGLRSAWRGDHHRAPQRHRGDQQV